MSVLGQVKGAPDGKFDTFVAAQLGRSQRRVWGLDAICACLALLAAGLGYLLFVILADNLFELPAPARRVSLIGFGAALAGFLAMGAFRLCRRVNPYYAARQVERVTEGSKNSVVNWLDLHKQPLPHAIHTAVTRRAARDLHRVDLEQAISGRRAAWLGSVLATLLVLLLLTFLLLGPLKFGSLFDRALTPFSATGIAARTSLQLIEPTGGDAVVPIGREVAVEVAVDGRVPEPGRPDSLRLLYHYRPEEPYLEKSLDRGQRDRWSTQVPAAEVGNGFWYKIAGGDAATTEYRIQVRSRPLLSRFEVRYHFRPYLRLPDQTSTDPNLDGMRGTEVRLLAWTTSRVRDGRLDLELDGQHKSVVAESVPGQPQALQFRLLLEASGSYRIRFTSGEGEQNDGSVPYRVTVKTDHAPRVVLTSPSGHTRLPANALLPLAGVARDDFGLSSMTLQVVVGDEPETRTRPYRDAKAFRMADGSLPRQMEYRDSLDLSQVRLKNGGPLAKGTVLQCWLEAADNCDSPGPNIGRSEPPLRIVVEDPDPSEQRKRNIPKQGQSSPGQGKQGGSAPRDGEPGQDSRPPQPGSQARGSDPLAEPKDLDQKIKQVDKAIQDRAKSGHGEGGSGGDQGNAKSGQPQEKDSPPQGDRPNPGGKGGDGAADGQKMQAQPHANAASKEQPGGASGSSGDDGQRRSPDRVPGSHKGGTNESGQRTQPGQESGAPVGKPGSKSEERPAPSGGPGHEGSRDATEKGHDPGAAGRTAPGEKRAGTDQVAGSKQGPSGQTPGSQGAGNPSDGRAGSPDTGKGSGPDKDATGVQRPATAPLGRGRPGQPDAAEGGKAGKGSETPETDPRQRKGASQPARGEPLTGAGPDDSAHGQQPGQRVQPAAMGQRSNQDKVPGATGEAPGSQNRTGDQTGNREDEIGQLAAQLKSSDPKTRETARQKLTHLKRSAADAQTREKAGEALKQEGMAGTGKSDQEVSNLATALRGSQPEKREQARQKLENLARNAGDEDTRQAARDALDADQRGAKEGQGAKQGDQGDSRARAEGVERRPDGKPRSGDGEGEENAPGSAEARKGPEPGSTSPKAGKGQTPDSSAPPGREKAAGGAKAAHGDQGAGQGSERADKGTPASGPSNDGQPTNQKNGTADGPQPGQAPGHPGNVPGGSVQGDRQNVPPEPPGPEAPSAAPADPTAGRKAGDLQLEDYQRKLTKDVLKSLNWTDQDKQDFLGALRERAKGQRTPPLPPEKLPDPRRSGGSLGNTSPRRVTGAPSGEDRVRYTGPSHPPSPFRDASKEWNEKVQELERGRDR